MRLNCATRVVLLAMLALVLLDSPAMCKEKEAKAGWTCESDGFWHENGVKSQYTCAKSDSKADDGSKGDETADASKEDATTACPGDGIDAGFNGASFNTTIRTCIKGPPNDVKRCWWTYRPNGQSGQIPLVVDMHGGGGCASHRARSSGFKALADTKAFAVAWPAGYANEWGTCGSDCAAVKAASNGKSITSTDDLTFITDLIAYEAAPTTNAIDPKRVYLTGFSMGCMMAHRFAMERSDLVAGFGCHGGDLIGAGDDLAAQKVKFSIEPMAAFMTGGSSDAWFAQSAFLTWRVWNGCDGGTTTSMNVTSPRVGNVKRGIGCDAPTARYVINDAGHTEDSAMATETWDFIASSTRPGATAVIAEMAMKAPVTSAGSREPVAPVTSAGSREPVNIAVFTMVAFTLHT